MDRKEQAKKVTIESLYQGQLKHLGSEKLGGLCPFHHDSDKKNVNFIVYINTNSWYCFVCRNGGDAITFYMKKNKCDFKTALKEML